MNKMMTIASALVGAIVMTGCASTGGNPITEWQSERSCAEVIAAKNAAGEAITLEDVLHKSDCDQQVIAAGMNTLAVVSAPLYLQVVTAVDQLAASQEGRRIYIGIQQDIEAGAKAEEILAAMPPEDKAAYKAYEASISQVNQESVMNDVVKPLLETLAAETIKASDAIAVMTNDPALKTLAYLELARASKAIGTDSKAITQQLSDATVGAKLWLDLLAKDKEAKAFMADYPVE